MAQAVQIPKQAPEGSCWGPLDSLEHTNFSLLAAPEAPLASCRTWTCGVAAQADLDLEVERSECSRQSPQDWNLSSVPQEQAVL